MKDFVTNSDKDFVNHDIIVDCDCLAHLLRVTQFSGEDSLSITHYSCSPSEVDDSKNSCWDIILNKEKALKLAESILQIYKKT